MSFVIFFEYFVFPRLFRLDSIENNEDLSDQRLVVDYSEDLELASKIITSFSEGEIFTIKKIKDFFSKNPKKSQIKSKKKSNIVKKK